ncbi:hypothetical protein ACFE04_018936 [Oxalis oulophora]
MNSSNDHNSFMTFSVLPHPYYNPPLVENNNINNIRSFSSNTHSCMADFHSPPPSQASGSTNKGRKRKRGEKVGEKPREVIHVRAKRGQATDSHSLAERVRREKINDRLKSLKDLVPGCYKTMGMAVMLDVIINYVQSLQNQIQFLSMKLSAASMYYDFNSPEIETNIETMQGTNEYDVQEMEGTIARESYGDPSYVHPSWPLQFGL